MALPRNLSSYAGDPIGALQAELSQLWAGLQALQRATTLRDASISGGRGLRILEEVDGDGDLAGESRTRIWISPDGTITVYDDSGEPAVRFGTMTETRNDPGADLYGIEIRVGNDWIQLGTQVVEWGNVGNKPGTYDPVTGRWDPRPHRHGGGEIDGVVSRADTTRMADDASRAGTAALADGSRWAFDNTVSGTQFYAVWVGNDGGFHLGRNVSSERYKEKIRDWDGDPKAVLQVELKKFKRKAKLQKPAVGEGPELLVPGSDEDEFGVIAEQSHEHVPEATQWYEGEIDGVRYELYGVLLIPIVREHEERISALEDKVETLESTNQDLLRRLEALERKQK